MIERERTSNSNNTTKPRVVSKSTQVTKIGTEHPRMWHPARYRRMHRTHDSEPYPRSIYGLKSPHTVGQIFHTHQLCLFIVCNLRLNCYHRWRWIYLSRIWRMRYHHGVRVCVSVRKFLREVVSGIFGGEICSPNGCASSLFARTWIFGRWPRPIRISDSRTRRKGFTYPCEFFSVWSFLSTTCTAIPDVSVEMSKYEYKYVCTYTGIRPGLYKLAIWILPSGTSNSSRFRGQNRENRHFVWYKPALKYVYL